MRNRPHTDRVTVTTYVRPYHAKVLRDAAEKSGVSLSLLVNQIISQWIFDRLEDKP